MNSKKMTLATTVLGTNSQYLCVFFSERSTFSPSIINLLDQRNFQIDQ